MVLNVAIAFSGKVKISMVGQIDDGISISGRLIVNFQRRSIQRIPYGYRQIARIAFFPICGKEMQTKGIVSFLLDIPQLPVKAVLAAMQVVGSVVA